MILEALDVIGFVGGISGAVLVGKFNRNGFLAFIVGSIAHGIMGYLQGNFGLTGLCMTFIIIDIYYYIAWGKNVKGLG
jgi:hypothetical protein